MNFSGAPHSSTYMCAAFGTNDGMIGIREGLETQAISRCAIENEEDLNVFPKCFLNRARRRMRICVIAISDHMALIGSANCLQDIRMDSGIVVAGKATGRFHEFNNLAEDEKLKALLSFFKLKRPKMRRVLDNLIM